MIPVFKDEEAKEKYLNSMLGLLTATENIVKETKEKIQGSDNKDNLVDALEFFGGCLYALSCGSQKILEDSQKTNLHRPTYEEKYQFMELLGHAYTAVCEEDSKSELESRRPQKVKAVNELAQSIRMGHGEFRP